MTFVSDYPISVDGVRLDTLAWGIETSSIRLGGLRSGDQVLAGLDGLVASLEDAREASSLTLGMFVRGTDADGLVPAGREAQSVLRENLDDLKHLFARTDSLLDVRETVDEAGTERQVLAKVTDALEPDLEPGCVARFTVALTIPGCYWRDLATADWSQAAVVSGTAYEVTTLAGSSAPVDDAALLLEGPANNPVITDPRTGAFVRLNGSLAAGDKWRVDSGAWQTRQGTTLGLGSLPTTGTDQSAITDQGGKYPRLLRLSPERQPAGRRVRVQVTGTGFTAATTLHIRARRAYL